MPSKEEIFKNAKKFISQSSGFPSSALKANFILKKHPIMLNDSQLVDLTLKLRSYVKKFNAENTVLVSELKKSNLTVEALCELISNKIL